tara:strand:+ start:210 stop:560 length:351 start_codon:yes stop_codon:yes gene_type:complete
MTIQRIHTNDRMSQIVIHSDTIYLSGQVASGAPGGTVTEQTKDILSRIEGYLAEAGSDKSKLLSATLWITDMADFAEMNAVWDSWVASGEAPCRACVESKLASNKYDVEIMVIAAK